ncbi:flavin-dependent monooxygenase [Marinomonas rhizomae]|uniref:Alkylation response protein AidB-like acyl-CoA dehydrogenase n=1 Tax=Marinomonas rhizomae TaxID=491948 RepID=A0A366J0B9_9GAMM|nr:flavin-dependent monooxygenase [Marinomonas rhizomae]RBP80481.1 alkylation response protein AidB-like acyl-CoA dehydrogenase [Marinomonas rhizomae]RNF71718.1 flavin-dependent monooxygenase [Marinomonas rhizomae]
MQRANPLLIELQTVLPKIAENASQAEELRQAPKENIDLLKQIGLHKAFLPKAYGGYEISLPEFGDCIAALAGACASTAWAFSLLCTHNHQIALFPKQAQDDIWKENPDALASSSIAPFGKYQETDGGVMFTGDMRWSSGCDHAQWALCGFLRENAEGGKDHCFALIPATDYTIDDDWQAAAMKGSGTKTLVVREKFVPEHRIQKAKDMMEGKSGGFDLYPDSKIFYAPYRPYFASGFSAISLGIAERMLTVFKEATQGRIRAYTGAKVGTATPALLRIAEASHQVMAARAFLEKTWEEHAEYAEAHRYPDRATLAEWRTNQAYVVKMCIEAVDRLFSSMGASHWYLDKEAQRLFRDSHVTGAHAYTDYDVCAQIFGREIMGLEPDPSLL